jgi:serine/threonine protein kinase
LNPDELLNERRGIEKVYRRGTHENIVTVLAHGWLPDQSFYCVDLELGEVALSNYIHDYYTTIKAVFPNDDLSPFDLTEEAWRVFNAWSIINQISSGLEFIHRSGQIHGDLKTTNSISHRN